MNTLLKVARYHLIDRLGYMVLPCAVTAFTFLVNLLVTLVVPEEEGNAYTGGLLPLIITLFVLGVFSVTRSLPFGFALGLSRRTYYLGTILLIVGVGAFYALAVAVFQGIERVSGGWWIDMYFFRVPWIMNGSWYLTWLTSFVVMVLLFVYGMWFGLVYRRWSLVGLFTFIAAQVSVVVAAVLLVTWTGSWASVGSFFLSLSVTGLTGVLAAVAAALAAGGFTTMRRVTI